MLPPLHSKDCRNEDKDVERMKNSLGDSLEILEQHLAIPSPWQSNSPLPMLLYNIIAAQHINCLKFILKVGKVNTIVLNTAFSFVRQNSNDSENYINMMELLLQSGACPNHYSNNDMTFSTDWLFLAIDNGYMNEFRLLLEYGAETEDQEILDDGTLKRLDDGRTSPLTHAISHCNTEALKLLLLHKASTQVFFEYHVHGYVQYSIPHFILYNYYESEEALQILKIYHDFGGNLWSIDSFGHPYTNMIVNIPDVVENENILEAIQNRPALQNHRNIINSLEDLMKNPPSLCSLTRIVIKNNMCRNYWKNIKTLELPRELKQYLQYNIPPR
jgi:ankyrin repeat protein